MKGIVLGILESTDKAAAYTDLSRLIVKIANYIFRKDARIQKGIGEIMGGKVLELESERLLAKGRNEGEERLSNLINLLIVNNRSSEIPTVASDKAKRDAAYKEFHL